MAKARLVATGVLGSDQVQAAGKSGTSASGVGCCHWAIAECKASCPPCPCACTTQACGPSRPTTWHVPPSFFVTLCLAGTQEGGRWVYTLKFLIEDATGQLDVILFGPDGDAFFSGMPAQDMRADEASAARLLHCLECLRGVGCDR